MGKYDEIKKLVKKKARVDHKCSKCGRIITRGTDYYKEDIGRINKPPNLLLRDFCLECFNKTC
jgi:hypothetical protein